MQSTELELIYETSPAGLCFLDAQLRYRRINKKLASIHGLPQEAHLGRTIRELLPEIADMVEPFLRQVLETRKPILDLEIHGRVPANPAQESYWQGSYYPLTDAQGEILGVNVVVVDITERKRAETELRESAERFRFLAESMPHITFTAKPNGELDYFNQELTKFTGLSAEAIKGWGWTEFVHPDDVKENVRAWRHCMETGQSFKFEHRFRSANGVYRWFLCRAIPMRDAQG